MKDNFKKILAFFILISVSMYMFIGATNISYADDEDEKENLQVEDVLEEINASNENEAAKINDLENSKKGVTETAANTDNENLKLNSRRYAIYDRLSKRVVYGKDFDKESAMASTTKIMSAIIVLENCDNLNQEVQVNKKAAQIRGSVLGLKENDKITINDLMHGLLMRSGNDCAIELSIAIGGSTEDFVELMNEKAKEMKLKHTHFTSPHGLDNPEHYTTPEELAKITDYALKNKKFSEIVKTKNYTIHINGNAKNLKNTNEVLCSNIEGVYGVKTGFTNNAGRCLVTSVKRNNLDFIIVVLNADSRKYRAEDTIKLINFAFNNFRYINLEEKINEEFESWKNINLKRIMIEKGAKDLKAELRKNVSNDIIKEVAIRNEITFETNTITYLKAPVYKGTQIGNIAVKDGDEIIETIDIVAKEDISRKSIKNYYLLLLKYYGS